jgi:hypothetical protein
MATELNLAFIERRMAEHKRWQHEAEYALIEEIIDEVQELPKRRPRTARLFEVLPGHVQGSIVADLEERQ